MKMEEKIKVVNNLNRKIDELKSLLCLLENSNIESRYDSKMNVFKELTVSAYVWTGTQNPINEKKLTDVDTINECSEAIKTILRMNIGRYEVELEGYFTK